MRPLGIRNRILLAALAPAALVALLISTVLVVGQMEQSRVDQHRRLGALARQLSAAAEYNLFVGNTDGLRRLLDAALAEPDVTAAAILDAHGKVLASSVPTAHLPAAADVNTSFSPPSTPQPERHWHGLIIRATHYGEEDLFIGGKGSDAPPLGQLLLQVSGQSLNEDLRRHAYAATATTLFMLFLGILLALALSRDLIRTLGGIGRVVEGIGQGKTHLRVENIGTDELGHLAEGINEMATAVAQTQEDLALRIANATATLRRERDEAEAAAEARSRFFAAASHDLRQPLQALGLFVARLERDIEQAQLIPQVHKIGQAVRSLQGLLDTLLDYSRLDGQVYRVERRPVSATDVIGRLIDNFADAAQAKHLTLRTRSADCWLMTDPGLLHRILLNLLSNAVRYTRSGGILVICRRGATHARIEVWDTGPGIPVTAHSIIFEELVQLDNPERDAAKGLGLGLAIVRRTADLLGHPLDLCSRVGHGSRFSISVPLTSPPPPESDSDAPLQESCDPLDRARLLIVDANAAGPEQLVGMLDGWGCQPIVVASADAARDWIIGHGPPSGLLWNIGDAGADVEEALALIGWLEIATGYRLPAIVIGTGPMPPFDDAPDKVPRLLLARPFRPARLRALLMRVLAPP